MASHVAWFIFWSSKLVDLTSVMVPEPFKLSLMTTHSRIKISICGYFGTLSDDRVIYDPCTNSETVWWILNSFCTVTIGANRSRFKKIWRNSDQPFVIVLKGLIRRGSDKGNINRAAVLIKIFILVLVCQSNLVTFCKARYIVISARLILRYSSDFR